MNSIDLLVEELVRGNSKNKLIGKPRLLMKYFTPSKDPREFNHVKLRPLTLVGFMEMGKTETAKYFIHESMKYFRRKSIGTIAFMGKTIVDIMYYIEDNKDLLQGNNIAYIFVDDLFYGGTSTEKTKGKKLGEKIYSDIRHWPERMGVSHGIIYVLFAAQRYSLIPVFFRNSPFIIFKGLVIQDRYEKQVIKDVLTSGEEENKYTEKLADILVKILVTIAKKALIEYRDDVKALSVVKPLGKKPYIFIQPKLAKPEIIHVPFNYSGVFPEEARTLTTETMTKQQKKQLLKIIAASIQIGIKLREYDIGALTRRMLDRITREVLGIGFNQNLINAEIIQEAWNNIDKKALARIIDGKTPRAVIIQ